MRAYVIFMTQRLFLADRSPPLALRTPPRQSQYAITAATPRAKTSRQERSARDTPELEPPPKFDPVEGLSLVTAKRDRRMKSPAVD